MKLTLFAILALSLSAAPASADVVSCVFTEPFFNLEIDTVKKTLKKTEPDWNSKSPRSITTVLSRNVKINRLPSKKISVVAEVPRYQVIADGKPVLVLWLSYQGSDGMSDFAYPYEVSYDDHIGGCESDKLKRHMVHYGNENQ